MNWDQVQGAWMQLGGELKLRWARLTDDDVLALEGTKDVFLGKLRQRTGQARQSVERQLTALIARVENGRRPNGVICLPA